MPIQESWTRRAELVLTAIAVIVILLAYAISRIFPS